MPTPKIVVIGNSFSSGDVFAKLESHLNQTREPYDLLFISDKKYYLLNKLLPQYLALSSSFEDFVEFNREIKCLRPSVGYLEAKVIGIDYEKSLIKTSKGEVEYKFLVLAPECDLNERNENFDDASYMSIDTLENLLTLKKHILSLLESASSEPDVEKKKSMLTFVIDGSKQKDIEIAFSISDFVRNLLRSQFTELKKAFLRIELVEGKNTIECLKEPYFNSYLFYNLNKKNIKVHTNSKITNIQNGKVSINDSFEIASHTIIGTSTNKFSSLIKCLALEKDSKNKAYVDLYLRAQGKENIFIIGESSKCLDLNEVSEKSDFYFKEQSSVCANNILALINGNPLKPFKLNLETFSFSLGSRNAIFEVKNLCFYGIFAWVIYRLIYIWYFISWKKKIKVFCNFILNIFGLKENPLYDLIEERVIYLKLPQKLKK